MSMRAAHGKYNTGSDLLPQKTQEAYAIVNGRIGIQGGRRWSLELWAQNLFNKNYQQVAFNSPFQARRSTTPPFAPGFTASSRSSPAAGRSFVPGRAADVWGDSARKLASRAPARRLYAAARRLRRRRRRRPARTGR